MKVTLQTQDKATRSSTVTQDRLRRESRDVRGVKKLRIL